MDKLDKYRKKIDDIDSTLIKVLAKRMRIVERVGKFKKRNHIDTLQPDRWNSVLNRVKVLAIKSEILDEAFIEDIWNRMHEEALKIEEQTK